MFILLPLVGAAHIILMTPPPHNKPNVADWLLVLVWHHCCAANDILLQKICTTHVAIFFCFSFDNVLLLRVCVPFMFRSWHTQIYLHREKYDKKKNQNEIKPTNHKFDNDSTLFTKKLTNKRWNPNLRVHHPHHSTTPPLRCCTQTTAFMIIMRKRERK